MQALPFADDRFDHAVAALVFCSVPDAEQGLRELLRVTKPGGSLRLLEHVGAEPGWTRRTQSALSPLWSRVGDGCRLDRDTVATAERAGVIVEAVQPARGLPRLLPTRLIEGRVPSGEGAPERRAPPCRDGMLPATPQRIPWRCSREVNRAGE